MGTRRYRKNNMPFAKRDESMPVWAFRGYELVKELFGLR